MLQSNTSRAVASIAIVLWAGALHYNIQSITQSDAYKNSKIGKSASTSVSFSLFTPKSSSTPKDIDDATPGAEEEED
jgi:hypothetical protein